MSKHVEQVEADALELPTPERARLAQRLIESLEEEPQEDPAEVERAWEAEIARRLAEYRRGTVPTVPASQVFTEIRARLQ
jgi:putative addiction module component (TIGR02574 family)